VSLPIKGGGYPLTTYLTVTPVELALELLNALLGLLKGKLYLSPQPPEAPLLLSRKSLPAILPGTAFHLQIQEK
jgi:hypothetical protein